MTAPRKFNFPPPLRGWVQKRNQAVVPIDASREIINMGLESGVFGPRRGYKVRRRVSTSEAGFPGRYGTFLRLADAAIFPWIFYRGTLYLDTGVHAAPSQVFTGFPVDKVASVSKLADSLIFNAAATTPKLWDGSTAYDAGMAAPGTSPTVVAANNTAARFSGKIRVRVTYGSTDWNVESGPSNPVEVGVYSVGQQLTLTNIPTSANARCNYRKIWVTDTSGERYFLALTISDNTTTAPPAITDFESDSTELTQYGGMFRLASVPSGDITCVHEGRLFVATNNVLQWSVREAHEVFHPLAKATFETPITSIMSHNGRLLVSGWSDLWSVTGTFDMALDGGNDYSGKHLSDGVGSVGRMAMTAAGTVAYVLSEAGLYSQEGDSAPAPITDEVVEDFIGTINDGQSANSVLAYNARMGELWCAVPVIDAQNPDQNQRVLTFRQKGETFGLHHLRLSWMGQAQDDGQRKSLFGFDYMGNVLRLNFGHGDGLQGDEEYGKTKADGTITTVDDGIDIKSFGADQMRVVLRDHNVPTGQFDLRGAKVLFLCEDRTSEHYGKYEDSVILEWATGTDTLIFEDPVQTYYTHVYLGGTVQLHVTPESDLNTPGATKIPTHGEIQLADPTLNA